MHRPAAGAPCRYLPGARYQPQDPAAEDPGRAADRPAAAPARPAHDQRALNTPVWLDLTRAPSDLSPAQRTTWQEAGLQFLARLNEQREPLRRTLSKPLILVLHPAEKARIKALVPDLWAIRHFSLETGPWLASATAPGAAHPEPSPSRRWSGNGNGCGARAAPSVAPSSPVDAPLMPCCGVAASEKLMRSLPGW